MDCKIKRAIGDIEPVKECSDFTSQDECEQEGCYWYDDSCHTEPTMCPACEDIDESIRCNYCGCFWWTDGTCHSEPKPKETCEEILNEDDCWPPCFWWGGACHTDPYVDPACPPYCELNTTQAECDRCKCFWWEGACHGTPPPIIICENFKEEEPCLKAGCHWYDESCHSEGEEVMTIEEIDRELHERLSIAHAITSTYLTEVVDFIFLEYGQRITAVENEVTPLTEFLTDEVKTSITEIVEAFGTPESLVSFLLDAPEGEEEAMLTLMQLLITNTLELGV